MTTLASSVGQLQQLFGEVRGLTNRLVEPLSAEDCVVQSMADVSPTRWHLAHTTWFFETFVLQAAGGYEVFDPDYNYLFNSYYNALGEQFSRPHRGLLSRPGLDKILRYRQYVDRHMRTLFASERIAENILQAIEIGLHHEQQHQELILTDIKHVLSIHPAYPAYHDAPLAVTDNLRSDWCGYPEELIEVGHVGEGFGYDNEFPRHGTFLHACELAGSPVTCGQYRDFIDDGGYRRADLWLSLGWNIVGEQQWSAPLYWIRRDGEWWQHTLAGLLPMDPDWPVCHVSYFEADAYARWAGARLPTEFEWERAAGQAVVAGQFCDQLLDDGRAIHPTRAGGGVRSRTPSAMYGGVWEWTSSSYGPYPGYRAPAGALGEYNGKFMCNQYVLRGGSVATSRSHIRPSYRNFFPPDARWQFSGIRLAADAV